MDRGAWQATVHAVSKSWTQLSMHTHKETEARKKINSSLEATVLEHKLEPRSPLAPQ